MEKPTPNILGVSLSCGQAMRVARGALEMAYADAIGERNAAAGQPKFVAHWTGIANALVAITAKLDEVDSARRAPADRSGDIMTDIFGKR